MKRFKVSLRSGVLLANVRYYWIVRGLKQSAQSAGIRQLDGSRPLFEISAVPPDNAEELVVYDNLNHSNWNVANYLVQQYAA